MGFYHDLCRVGALAVAALVAGCAAPSSTLTASAANDRAISNLSTELKSPEPQRRLAAALQVGRVSDARSTAMLVEAIHDPEATVRASAATGLGWLGDEAALPELEQATKDKSPVVSERATVARDTILQKRSAKTAEQERIVEAKAETQHAAKEQADYDARRHEEAEQQAKIRQRRIDGLIRVPDANDSRAIAEKLEATLDPEPVFRRAALVGLSNCESREAMLACVRLLSDPDEKVRELAHSALKTTERGRNTLNEYSLEELGNADQRRKDEEAAKRRYARALADNKHRNELREQDKETEVRLARLEADKQHILLEIRQRMTEQQRRELELDQQRYWQAKQANDVQAQQQVESKWDAFFEDVGKGVIKDLAVQGIIYAGKSLGQAILSKSR